MADSRVAFNDLDQEVSVSQYVNDATETFFSEAGTIDQKDWTHASVGLITLIILGAIIVLQVLSAAPSGGAH